MPTKDEIAEKLAMAHFQSDPGIVKIVRLRVNEEQEARAHEPIKLLEVDENTVPSGIQPVYFGPNAASGILFPSVVIDVTPAEFDRIVSGELKLPDGWRQADEWPAPQPGGATKHE